MNEDEESFGINIQNVTQDTTNEDDEDVRIVVKDNIEVYDELIMIDDEVVIY